MADDQSVTMKSSVVSWCGVNTAEGYYDMAPLSNADISFSDSTYYYYLRVCGSVLNDCSNSMMCQVGSAGSYSFAVSDPTRLTWSSSNDQHGMRIIQAQINNTGSISGLCTKGRSLNLIFICSINPINIISITENPTCYYTTVIATELLCKPNYYTSKGLIDSEEDAGNLDILILIISSLFLSISFLLTILIIHCFCQKQRLVPMGFATTIENLDKLSALKRDMAS